MLPHKCSLKPGYVEKLHHNVHLLFFTDLASIKLRDFVIFWFVQNPDWFFTNLHLRPEIKRKTLTSLQVMPTWNLYAPLFIPTGHAAWHPISWRLSIQYQGWSPLQDNPEKKNFTRSNICSLLNSTRSFFVVQRSDNAKLLLKNIAPPRDNQSFI